MHGIFLRWVAAVLLACSAAFLGAQDGPIPVLFVGTYHMANPGPDLAEAEAGNILSPKRQAELERMAAKLAKFKPTKIAVEVPFRLEGARQPVGGSGMAADYVDRYGAYLQGEGEVERNEVYQLAFRLGKNLGHSQIYGIDSPLGLDFGRVMKTAERNGQTALVEESAKERDAMAAEMTKSLASMTLPQFFVKINAPEFARSLQAPYLKYALNVGRAQDYIGANLVADWYRRNLRIFANLNRIAAPGDRILVLFGVGHVHLLRQFTADSPRFALTGTQPYL
jgi:hypothetical protein